MTTMADAPGSGAPVSWQALIGEIGAARRRLAVEVPEVYPLTFPHVGAEDEQLAAAQQRLGRDLDEQHRTLLAHVNGWSEFFVHTDLLSTDELGAPGVWSHARDLLISAEEDWPPGYVPSVDELDILAASTTSGDIFLVWRTGPTTDGGHPVLWLGSGQRIEQWSNVTEMLRSVLAYTRRTLEDVLADRPPSSASDS